LHAFPSGYLETEPLAWAGLALNENVVVAKRIGYPKRFAKSAADAVPAADQRNEVLAIPAAIPGARAKRDL
jgi:hypothetical protein